MGIYCGFCCYNIDRIGNGGLSFGKVSIDEPGKEFENGIEP
jgi:hypothetical protein